MIFLDRTIEGAVCDTIVVDNLNAVYMATEQLISRGHRRIGLIAGPQSISTARERMTGYRRVLSDYSLPVDESLIVMGDYGMESGSRLFNRLLDMPDPPTAICVTNYDMTIGAITAAHERGVALPRDIDLIGYDNIDLCRIVSHTLEIVEQPMDEMGRAAAELIAARLAGDASPRKVLRLKARLAKLLVFPTGGSFDFEIQYTKEYVLWQRNVTSFVLTSRAGAMPRLPPAPRSSIRPAWTSPCPSLPAGATAQRPWTPTP